MNFWVALFAMGALKTFNFAHVWSDGGAADFYNSTSLHFYSLFPDLFGISVGVSFFESHHGHSRCDGHIGNGKQRVKKLAQLLKQSYDNLLTGQGLWIWHRSAGFCRDKRKKCHAKLIASGLVEGLYHGRFDKNLNILSLEMKTQK